ncbi:MAG: NADP-dependent malic enzyme [Candidatus Shapirobacteria bacterium]|nr:NADP-dependent malic enzyme [Candidatus Shapirobacteria bacterium]
MINLKVDYATKSLEKHKQFRGKIEIKSKFGPVESREDLSIAYTPGVAAVSTFLAQHPEEAKNYSIKGNTVAVVSDGSAVLGLGNIGPLGALPVMEGKALLFKEFANVDAFPIVLNTQDVEEIVKTVKAISPTFGGINLEDISSPRCFEVEERLKAELDIPVFHDDQHGTAIVVLAALINSLKLAGKLKENIKLIISGVGAAGVATAKLLVKYGVANIIMVDSTGIISSKRTDLNPIKQEMLMMINKNDIEGNLKDALKDADVFIGVSGPNILNSEDIKTMAPKPIVFAMANPAPEIMPDEAKKGGAFIVGTGRSDFANQINNVMVFPGIFRGALDHGVKQITNDHKIKVAEAIANYVPANELNPENILPSTLDKNVAKVVAEAIR